MDVDANSFKPAWWLPGPHLQTSWSAFTRPIGLVAYRREAVDLPDGDEIILDHVDSSTGPRLILLHGLEGSSYAVYVQGLAARAVALGWAVTAFNFRSCARDPGNIDRALPNRTSRLYHAGETEDLNFVIELLARREPGRALLASGVSLGGNAILKLLGEQGTSARLAAACTISVPYDLEACAVSLSRGINRLYAAVFLRRLKAKVRGLAARFPETAARIDVTRALRSRDFIEFDAAVTAPLHGWASASDYYTRTSSVKFLAGIAKPVLCINAADDPFQPPPALEAARQRMRAPVSISIARTGGHAAFVQGTRPGATSSWAEEAAVAWLARQV